MLRSLVGSEMCIRDRGISSDEIKNKLRENTEFAIGKGSFGVPTFYLENEMFWGIDSMKFLIEDIQK